MEILDRVISDEDWRENLDTEVRRKLEKLLKRIKSEEKAYKRSDHEAIAQLWVAAAEIFHKVDSIDNRLRSIEKILEGKDKKGMGDSLLRESLEKY